MYLTEKEPNKCPECSNTNYVLTNYVLDGGDGSLCQNEFHNQETDREGENF